MFQPVHSRIIYQTFLLQAANTLRDVAKPRIFASAIHLFFVFKILFMSILATLPRIPELWAGFWQLIYPDLCVACEAELPRPGACFCISCHLKLTPSDMYRLPENEFTDRFWGRIPLTGAAAMYYFTRKSPIQHALHELKYRNRPDVGIRIGRAFGQLLRQAPHFQTVDAIVPVPLHPKKERLRGYNQSAMFGQGIAEAMEIPQLPHALMRALFTATQTRKKRMDRFQNVEQVFVVKKPALVEGKHILLIDDVLTTGATLERCAEILIQVPGVQLSMATIAIATN